MLLAIICLFAYLTKKFMAAVVTLFVFMFLKMLVSDGTSIERDYFISVCIICTTIMIAMDGKLKKGQSLFLKCNPYVANSRLPAWLRLTLLMLFLSAFILRVIATIMRKP